MSLGPTAPQTVPSLVGDFVIAATITERRDGEFDIDTSISEVRTQVASIPVVLTFGTLSTALSVPGLPATDTAIFRRYLDSDGLLSLGCEVDLETYESAAHMIYADGVEADAAAVESFAIEAATLVREIVEKDPRIVQKLNSALVRTTGAAMRLISAEQRKRADQLNKLADMYAEAAEETAPEATYAPSF